MEYPAHPEEADFALKSYDYFLPSDLIAMYPAAIKDECRLMVLNRDTQPGAVIDDVFSNIGQYLPKNALLVANNSKVIPARLMGKRPCGGNLEFLLLTPLPLLLGAHRKDGQWLCAEAECLLRPSSRLKIGMEVSLAPNLNAKVKEKGEFGRHLVELRWQGELERIFLDWGKLPLPPYIKRAAEEDDQLNYQTVYAKKPGSVAAPTAGLHFTDSLRERLLAKGFGWTEVTLYVGYGTFSPVRCADIREHKIHSEYVEVQEEAANCINEAKKSGRPIVAVGTTSMRVMEGVWDKLGAISPGNGWTDIFIYPGKKINVADGLITNFHLPQSSLLMLVSAFAGRKRILDAYKHGVDAGYRFFSYGDAMLIC